MARHRLLYLNSLIGGVIGTAFGVIYRNPLAGLVAGLFTGAFLGWLTEQFFARVNPQTWFFRRRLTLLVLVEMLLLLYLVVPAIGAYGSVYPSRQPAPQIPADLAGKITPISFYTRDGVAISAWYLPSQNGAAIIALHGLSGNRAQVLAHARALANQGYGVLMMDMRAHGESGGERFSSWLASRDVLAAVEFLKNRTDVDQRRIGAMGLSSGAYAALCAAAQTQEIQALFLEGVGLGRTSDAFHPMLKEFKPNFFMTPLNWMYFAMIDTLTSSQGERPIRVLLDASTPRAIIFVAAGLDPFEPALAERYAGWGGDTVNYWVVPDVNHVGGMFTHPEEYAGKMLAFFDRYLLEAP